MRVCYYVMYTTKPIRLINTLKAVGRRYVLISIIKKLIIFDIIEMHFPQTSGFRF